METAETALVKSTDVEEIVEARDGLNYHLPLHMVADLRVGSLPRFPRYQKTQAGVSGNFRKNPN